MHGNEFPLVILGGSDRSPGVLPPAGSGKHPLSGYKAVDIRISGRPMIEHLVERLRTCPEFDPIGIVGPRSVYGPAGLPVEIIDADRDVARNLETAVEWACSRRPGRPIGVVACDILPDPGELRRVLDDWACIADCPAWFPLVPSPADPGRFRSFAWKPEYGIVPGEGQDPIRVLPGHLGIIDPEALRLPLILQLMRIAYRTRNLPIETRRGTMLRKTLMSLVGRDVIGLLRLRAPVLTWTVVSNGLLVARKLGSERLLQSDLQDALTRITLRRKIRRRHPERRVRIPIVDALSLARDVDTEEEAREIAEGWEG